MKINGIEHAIALQSSGKRAHLRLVMEDKISQWSVPTKNLVALFCLTW